MAGERFYTRIPPSSTGNRIGLKHTAAVSYTNRTGLIDENAIYTLSTSGIKFTVHTIRPINLTTGLMIGTYDKNSAFFNLSPTGENIINDDGVVVGQIGTTVEDIFTNVTNIVGFNNASYGLRIDEDGSANIRFSEGVPQLDAFGKLRISGATLLGEYVFSNGIMPQYVSTTELGNSSATWDNAARAMLLSTGTLSGDCAKATTNTYHHYIPGSSHLILMTLALGDNGKANVQRDWGMYDERNGVFFRLNGTTLNCVVRSDTSGTVINNVIPRSEWNVDKLDGTGQSGMVIDLSKDNLYFIDNQWLGAGRVRFGVFYNGARVICHEYNHGNTSPLPYSGTMSLPARFDQENLAASGSSSEMRVFCVAVWTECDVDDVRVLGRPATYTTSKIISVNDTPTMFALMAPAELYGNGRTNHSIYFPTEIEILSWDTVTGEPVPMQMDIVAEPTVSGVSLTPVSETVEADSDPTWYGGGQTIYSSITPGHEHADLTRSYDNMTTGAVKNYADQGGTHACTLLSISNSSPAQVVAMEDAWMLREGQPLTIKNAQGMTEANGQTVYLKITGLKTGQLYTNAALTVPFDTTTYGDYVADSGQLFGYFGSQFYWALIATKLYGTNPAKVICKIAWKEIRQ